MNIGKTLLSPLLQAEVPALSDFPHSRDAPVCHFVALHWTLSSASATPSGWQYDPVGESATPPCFVLSADLLMLHPAPPFRSLMRMLNRTGPNIDPSCTQPVTNLQLRAADQRPWAQPGRQPSVHLTISSSSPNFSSFSTRILEETMSKASLKSRYMVHTALPCLSSHPTTEHIS